MSTTTESIGIREQYLDAVLTSAETDVDPSPDALRIMCFEMDKSKADFQSDVARARQRLGWVNGLERAAELELRLPELAQQREELAQNFERVYAECQESIQQAEQPLREFDARHEKQSIRSEVRELKRCQAELKETADPAITREIRRLVEHRNGLNEESERLNQIALGVKPSADLVAWPTTPQDRQHWESKLAGYESILDDSTSETKRKEAAKQAGKCRLALQKMTTAEDRLAEINAERQRISQRITELESLQSDWRSIAL